MRKTILMAISLFAFCPIFPAKALPNLDKYEPCLKEPEAAAVVESIDIFDQVDNVIAAHLIVNSRGSTYDALRVVSLSSDTCELVYSDVYSYVFPLSKNLPLDIAKRFRLAWESRMLEKFGDRSSTQKWLSNVPSLSIESQWAFQELGFKLPRNIKTCPEETPQSFTCR